MIIYDCYWGYHLPNSHAIKLSSQLMGYELFLMSWETISPESTSKLPEVLQDNSLITIPNSNGMRKEPWDMSINTLNGKSVEGPTQDWAFTLSLMRLGYQLSGQMWGRASFFFSGHDINDAVFPLVKNDLPVIKRGLLENPPCVVDFPRDTSFSRGFPS